ncbi:MAG TPA: hypothetical protein VN625_08900 [Desulfuromonadaceae bacterium]|nr:hypothetical protein [Desulfuromonadaceae bacterium]
MTEVEAQKFIARWTPGRHRCEVTRAKIRRIRGQFWVVFFNGVFVFVVPFLKLAHLRTESHLFQVIRFIMVALGIANMTFALFMMWKLDRARRVVLQAPPTRSFRRPKRATVSASATMQPTEIVNG